jgi:hypothetical protein
MRGRPHDFGRVTQQFVEYMTRAVAERDPLKALRLLINAERICNSYTATGFVRLAELQGELQSNLHTIFCMARRQFIKRALLSPAHEFRLYLDDMRDPSLHLDGRDALADYERVIAHLDSGEPLNADLHKRTKLIVVS